MTIYEDNSLQTRIVNKLPTVMSLLCFAMALVVYFVRC